MTADNRILRVFPRRTSHTPTDVLTVVGEPGLWIPNPDAFDEIHVSVVFTWDQEEGRRLHRAWRDVYPHFDHMRIRYGGPGFGEGAGYFVPGRYARRGITYSSRGCPNHCPWCLVPKREGPLVELPNVAEGNVLQDNNFLACSKPHRRKVYEMLRRQRAVKFAGGLEARRLTAWDAEQIRSLRLDEVWFAADQWKDLPALGRAIGLLGKISREKVRCYCLAGFSRIETPDHFNERCMRVWNLGAMPFAQWYRPPDAKTKPRWTDDWAPVLRRWSRPAAMKAYTRKAV
ncbi:MAG TPA: hypothetical protein VFH53_00560 [Phycisphaerae bacterium]|nr:hypothetical protein [Phycisphaerae bacterium]